MGRLSTKSEWLTVFPSTVGRTRLGVGKFGLLIGMGIVEFVLHATSQSREGLLALWMLISSWDTTLFKLSSLLIFLSLITRGRAFPM